MDLLFCVGIGFDGWGVNLSVVCNVAKEITVVAKNALIYSCLNHALNNTLSKSVKVQLVRNSIETIQHIVQFFNFSAKRNFIKKKTLLYST